MSHDEHWINRAKEFERRFPKAFHRAIDSVFLYHGLNLYADGQIELDEMIDRLLVAQDDAMESYKHLMDRPTVVAPLVIEGTPDQFDKLVSFLSKEG